MDTSAVLHDHPLAHGRTQDSTAAPWPIYAVLFASTSVILGVIWDISWHRTIGRDTFWTPAHLAIYLGGVVAGLTCGWLALRTTFAGTSARARHGGALLGIPRAVRRVGVHLGRVRDADVGAVRRLVAQRLRPRREDHQPAAHAARGRHRRDSIRRDAHGARLAEPRGRRPPACSARLYLLGAGLLLLLVATVATEYIQRWDMHQSLFYQVVGGRVPVLPRQRGARIRRALAGDDDRARLHRPDRCS